MSIAPIVLAQIGIMRKTHGADRRRDTTHNDFGFSHEGIINAEYRKGRKEWRIQWKKQ